MILQVIAVFDVKAKAFSKPFLLGTVELAERAFSEAVNSPGANNEIAKYPEDHVLYHLGSFNDETGLFNNHPQPVCIGNALTYKKGAVRNVQPE